MAEGNSIKDEVKEQRKKFLTLTFTGKLQYIYGNITEFQLRRL